MEYKVNLAELDAIIPRLEGLLGYVQGNLGMVEDRVKALHTPAGRGEPAWTGEAADAHLRAHAEWTRGAQAMRDGLDKMRAAARDAHGSYSVTIAANLALLDRAGAPTRPEGSR